MDLLPVDWTTDFSQKGTSGVEDQYAPSGERFSKWVSGTANPGTTAFMYDGDDVVADYDVPVTGPYVYRCGYIQGTGIDSKLAQVDSAAYGGAVNFYDTDALGSVNQVVDAAGIVQETHLRSAWGEDIVGSTGITRYGFTQRENDDESGLVYFRARHFSPRLGRFVQRDPINKISDHYIYVDNNPIIYSDPEGLLKISDVHKMIRDRIKDYVKYSKNDPSREASYYHNLDRNIQSASRTIMALHLAARERGIDPNEYDTDTSEANFKAYMRHFNNLPTDLEVFWRYEVKVLSYGVTICGGLWVGGAAGYIIAGDATFGAAGDLIYPKLDLHQVIQDELFGKEYSRYTRTGTTVLIAGASALLRAKAVPKTPVAEPRFIRAIPKDQVGTSQPFKLRKGETGISVFEDVRPEQVLKELPGQKVPNTTVTIPKSKLPSGTQVVPELAPSLSEFLSRAHRILIPPKGFSAKAFANALKKAVGWGD
jgi:RHS repeat-associated protein